MLVLNLIVNLGILGLCIYILHATLKSAEHKESPLPKKQVSNIEHMLFREPGTRPGVYRDPEMKALEKSE